MEALPGDGAVDDEARRLALAAGVVAVQLHEGAGVGSQTRLDLVQHLLDGAGLEQSIPWFEVIVATTRCRSRFCASTLANAPACSAPMAR